MSESLIEAALVVLVPEAEALVKSFRDQYDSAAALGVPAHVTILYPFKLPSELPAGRVADLRNLFARFPAFRFALTETRRFPDVLYLAPDPDQPFRELIRRAAELFPETPPYGGAYPEVIPHLTIAQLADPDRLEMVAATFERAARGQLPIMAHAGEVAWMDNSDGKWNVQATLPLGAV